MPKIHKKLLVLACLSMMSIRLKAQQAPATNRQPVPPVQQVQRYMPVQRVLMRQRDYSWYAAEFRKRLSPAANIRLRSMSRYNTNRPAVHPSYQYMQQLLAKRFPTLQQNRTYRSLSARPQVMLRERPYSWFQQLARERLEGHTITHPPMNP